MDRGHSSLFLPRGRSVLPPAARVCGGGVVEEEGEEEEEEEGLESIPAMVLLQTSHDLYTHTRVCAEVRAPTCAGE